MAPPIPNVGPVGGPTNYDGYGYKPQAGAPVVPANAQYDPQIGNDYHNPQQFDNQQFNNQLPPSYNASVLPPSANGGAYGGNPNVGAYGGPPPQDMKPANGGFG